MTQRHKGRRVPDAPTTPPLSDEARTVLAMLQAHAKKTGNNTLDAAALAAATGISIEDAQAAMNKLGAKHKERS